MKNKRTYRTADQWQNIIRKWNESGLSASAFCKANQLGYASFCQWRQRLAQNTKTAESSDFINLSPLPMNSQVSGDRFHLNCRIGNWFELSLHR
ncbi:IS66 family transposase OrfA [Oleiphilus messinensis]|uniref:IS66 family transposase OrfA n=1 Tax=Oleiphilus messinensis TaxID=141451 RepID=A0A1Y0IAG5_9GAMM|nr:hypothetical protein [Oleiphilus messinensis]ARU57240.1 IS66 family transposase OrfA [Oleiphilus messinensis]